MERAEEGCGEIWGIQRDEERCEGMLKNLEGCRGTRGYREE